MYIKADILDVQSSKLRSINRAQIEQASRQTGQTGQTGQLTMENNGHWADIGVL